MLAANATVLEQLPDFSVDCDPRVARCLRDCVSSVLAGAALQGTDIGRYSTPQGRAPKHSIKRIHRMLWSLPLERSTEAILARVATMLMPHRAAHVIVLVDWVELRGSTCALVAGIPVDGRVVPIAFAVHANAKRPQLAIHERFLSLLARVLPRLIRPIIVTDAGFQGTWIAAVQRRGWDYVARLRHRTCVRRANGTWEANKVLHKVATTHPQCLGRALLGKDSKANRIETRLVLAKIPSNGRIAKGRLGRRLRGGKSVKIRAAAREPWLLATSLDTPARDVIAVYRERMKIEQFFRDSKSHAFGRALRQSITSRPRPLSALFLIAALAHIATVLVGRAVIAANKAKLLQANTTKGHLSAHRIGLLVLTSCNDFLPNRHELKQALRDLRRTLVPRR